MMASRCFVRHQAVLQRLAYFAVSCEITAAQALNKVQASVEKGSFWQQFSAVLALRMTPVLPFRYFHSSLCMAKPGTVILARHSTAVQRCCRAAFLLMCAIHLHASDHSGISSGAGLSSAMAC